MDEPKLKPQQEVYYLKGGKYQKGFLHDVLWSLYFELYLYRISGVRELFHEDCILSLDEYLKSETEDKS